MRQLSETGLKHIEDCESLSLTVYRDQGGKPTVGWGHLVLPSEGLKVGDTITREQADALLQADTAEACAAVEKVAGTIAPPLNDNQFAACVSLAFNIGVHAFESSTLAKLLEGGNLEEAAAQFDRWVYVDGRRSTGLVNRRAKDKQLFLAQP